MRVYTQEVGSSRLSPPTTKPDGRLEYRVSTDGAETAFVDVERRPPSVLPKVQIVKIDVERAEIDILGRMTSFGQTATCTGAR